MLEAPSVAMFWMPAAAFFPLACAEAMLALSLWDRLGVKELRRGPVPARAHVAVWAIALVTLASSVALSGGVSYSDGPARLLGVKVGPVHAESGPDDLAYIVFWAHAYALVAAGPAALVLHWAATKSRSNEM